METCFLEAECLCWDKDWGWEVIPHSTYNPLVLWKEQKVHSKWGFSTIDSCILLKLIGKAKLETFALPVSDTLNSFQKAS